MAETDDEVLEDLDAADLADQDDLDDLAELADTDLELTDADLEDAERQELEDSVTPAPGYESDTVTLDGREFVIEAPNIGIVLRIIRVFGLLGVRGERVALRSLQSIARGGTDALKASNRAVMFGMLAALQPDDLIALGSAVLQFDDDREGRRWLKAHQITLSPIVRALFLNLSKSADLRDSLNDFFVGMGMVEGIWGTLGQL